MKMRTAAILIGFAAAVIPLSAVEPPPSRPKAGKVEIFHLSDIKPGLKATAWTVLIPYCSPGLPYVRIAIL